MLDRQRSNHAGRVTLWTQTTGQPSDLAEPGHAKPLTVFVVDDDENARESVCALVAAMEVDVEAFCCASDFIASHDPTRRGCLVTDIRMPGISGLELQKHLNQSEVRLPVVIVSGFIDVRGTVMAMREGAVTVLTKPCEQQQLWDAIQCGLDLSQEWFDEDQQDADVRDRLAELSQSEHDVLGLVVEGLPNKATAKRLDVSIRTVEDRRSRIMKKLDVHSFASLLDFAHRARDIESRKSSQ
jgi:FixJ family two-component response regulator